MNEGRLFLPLFATGMGIRGEMDRLFVSLGGDFDLCITEDLEREGKGL